MRYLLLLLKLSLTVILVYFALKEIDFNQTRQIISSLSGLKALLVGVSIVFIQSLLGGYKMKPALQLFKYSISSFTGIRLYFLGSFFSQFFISFLTGDTVRVLALSKSGIKPNIAVQSIFLERVFGFIALQIMYLVALPYLLMLVSNAAIYWTLLSISMIGCCAVIVFISFGSIKDYVYPNNKIFRTILDLCFIGRYIFSSKTASLSLFGLSCLIQICNVLSIYAISKIVGVDISLFQAFIIVIPVIILAMLPISIAGWGVREYSMISAFALLGISSDLALTVSIIFGLSTLIVSLPGSIALFFDNKTVAAVS